MKLWIFVIQSTEIANVIDVIIVVMEIIVQGAAKGVYIIFIRLLRHLHQENMTVATWLVITLATVYKGNIIKNLIMDCQSYTKYRPNETTGGIFVSWRRKEELPTGA